MLRDNLLQPMCRSEELVFLKSELRSVSVKRKTSAEHSAQTSLFAAADRARESALFNSSFLLLTYGNDIGRFGDRDAVAFGVTLDSVFNCGLNFAKCFRCLPCQKSGSSHARVQFGLENKARARPLPFDLVHFESHRCAIESRALKRVPKFFLVFK